MTIQPIFGGPHVTAIGSGKGGTGKTFVSLTLAHAFAQEGERVLLCDADLGLSNTTVHLGIDNGGDIAGVLSGKKALKDAVAPVLGGVKTRGGFDLLAAPAGSGMLANPQIATLERLIGVLRASRNYDRIILDLAAGVDDAVLHLSTKADDTVLVMTPDPASLTDAYAFAKLLLRRGAAKPSVLVNMATNDQEARRTADALINSARAFLNAVPEYLGGIPRDPQVSENLRRQNLSLSVQSHAATAIAAVARKLHRCIAAPANTVNVR